MENCKYNHNGECGIYQDFDRNKMNCKNVANCNYFKNKEEVIETERLKVEKK